MNNVPTILAPFHPIASFKLQCNVQIIRKREKKQPEVTQCFNKPKNVFVLLFAREGLQIKDKDKLVSSPNPCVRTYGRDIQIFSARWVTNFYSNGAPPAGAFGARGSSATN